MGALLVEFARDSIAAHHLTTDQNAYSSRIDIDSASTHGCKNPAPVRIGASPCGFYQQGVGDGTRHLQSLGPRPGLLDPEADDMLHPFSISHNLIRKRTANLEQGGFELVAHTAKCDTTLTRSKQ